MTSYKTNLLFIYSYSVGTDICKSTTIYMRILSSCLHKILKKDLVVKKYLLKDECYLHLEGNV